VFRGGSVIEDLLLQNVDVDRNVVREAPDATFVRREFPVGPVGLSDARTPHVDLLKGAPGEGSDRGAPVSLDLVLDLAVFQDDILEFGGDEAVIRFDLVTRQPPERDPSFQTSGCLSLREAGGRRQARGRRGGEGV
jgi:hypothetical protein